MSLWVSFRRTREAESDKELQRIAGVQMNSSTLMEMKTSALWDQLQI